MRSTRLYARPTARAAVLLGAFAAATPACSNEEPSHPLDLAPLVLALPREPVGVLAALALEQGFFEAERVIVRTLDSEPSGKRALGRMLQGDADVAVTGETSIAFSAFERRDFRVLATIGASSNEPRLIARTDANIRSPADLRGKRVATQRGSAVHFYLHLFLMKHGIAESELELSFLRAEDLPEALAEGRIDAFSMREPFVGAALTRLGEAAVVFEEPGIYYRTLNLVAAEEVVRRRPRALRRLIAALVRAEDFARDRPDQLRAVMARYYGLSPAEAASVDAGLEPVVSLSQGLLVQLEEQARWARAWGLVAEAHLPNFLELMDDGPLRTVRPEAVTLLR